MSTDLTAEAHLALIYPEGMPAHDPDDGIPDWAQNYMAFGIDCPDCPTIILKLGENCRPANLSDRDFLDYALREIVPTLEPKLGEVIKDLLAGCIAEADRRN